MVNIWATSMTNTQTRDSLLSLHSSLGRYFIEIEKPDDRVLFRSASNSQITIDKIASKTPSSSSMPVQQPKFTKNSVKRKQRRQLNFKIPLKVPLDLSNDQPTCSRNHKSRISSTNSPQPKIGTFSPTISTRFKVSDEDIVFGSAYMQRPPGWGHSRIEWLLELERRQELIQQQIFSANNENTSDDEKSLDLCCYPCGHILLWRSCWGR